MRVGGKGGGSEDKLCFKFTHFLQLYSFVQLSRNMRTGLVGLNPIQVAGSEGK